VDGTSSPAAVAPGDAVVFEGKESACGDRAMAAGGYVGARSEIWIFISEASSKYFLVLLFFVLLPSLSSFFILLWLANDGLGMVDLGPGFGRSGVISMDAKGIFTADGSRGHHGHQMAPPDGSTSLS